MKRKYYGLVRVLIAGAVIAAASGCAAGRGRVKLPGARPEAIVPAAAQAPTRSDAGAPPPVTGSRLQVPPGESAAARALVLADQLAESKKQHDALAARARELERELESRDKALMVATTEIVDTRSELNQARADLERWKQELVRLREKLQAADKENLATLQVTVSLLQQMLADEQPAAAP